MRSCTVLIRQWERDTWGFVPRAFTPLLEANGRRMRDIEYLSLTVCPLLYKSSTHVHNEALIVCCLCLATAY